MYLGLFDASVFIYVGLFDWSLFTFLGSLYRSLFIYLDSHLQAPCRATRRSNDGEPRT